MLLKSLRFCFVFLLIFLTSLPSQTFSQSIGGTFFGVVKDPTGPVPQAEVRITNLATGQGRFVFTDEQGRYELREVPPGVYGLKVSKDGYNTVATPTAGLQLGLAQVARVDDITLKVAPAGTTTVEVNALDLAMTDSDRPTLSTAFAEKQVRELPLSARDVNNLAPLAPGVVSVSSFSFANTLVPFSVNGSRGRDNNFIIDSVDNNEPLFGGAATQFSNNEIFAEFRILTGQFQAEYGRNSGSIVNVVTKQGGKDLHGSLFWYGQNDALNAMTKVEKESQLTKPARFYDNQLGASVGGPIKKESTWFFASYQWNRARNDLSSEYPVVATLPTSAGLLMLQEMNALNPTPTLTAFLADPTVRTLPALTPPFADPCGSLPNATGTLNPTNPCTTGTANVGPPGVDCASNPSQCTSIPFGTYLVPEANVFDFRDHEGSGRIDQKLGQRENLFFRYLLDDLRTPLAVFNDPRLVGFSDLGLLPQWRNILAERTQNFGSSWAHAFDRALNELRFSFSRISSKRGALDVTPKARELPEITVTDAGVGGNFATPPSSGFPAAGNIISFGSDSRPAVINSNLFQVQENFSLVHGIHSLKFGGDFVETRSDLRQVNQDLGHYFYQSFKDLVNNNPVSGYQRFGNISGTGGEKLPLREFAQFYFAEDDIRISPSFTLNLGIRYENYGQAFNRVIELSATNANKPPKLGRVNTNFAPRIGFAWGLRKNTVLRGGYGIYYDPMFFNIPLLTWQSGAISPYVFSNVAVNSAQIPLVLSNKFPNPPFNPGDALDLFVNNEAGTPPADCNGNGFEIPNGVGSTYLDCTNQNTVSKNLRNPFVHNVSLSVQHQLQKDLLLELSYFGNRGTKLFQRRDLNPYGGWTITSPTPGQCNGDSDLPCAILRPRLQRIRGSISEMSNGAYSNYHALQFSATKRIRRGDFWNAIGLTAAYTWSHMTDNASEVFGPGVQRTGLAPAGPAFGQNPFNLAEPVETSTPFPQNPSDPRNGERGNSSFDRRHRFALSLVWESPSPGPKLAQTLLGNWEVNGVFAAQSGQPFTPINSLISTPGGFFSTTTAGSPIGGVPSSCGDVGGDGVVFNDRPNIGNPSAPANTVALLNNHYCLDPNSTVPGVSDFVRMSNSKIVQNCGDYIAPDGSCVNDLKTVRFVQVPLGGGFGNAGRNILTGPGTINLDLAVSKSFRLGEQRRLQFRADFYDLLNRQNPGGFAGNPYIASTQQVRAVAFDSVSINSSTGIAVAPTPARLNGITPENAIDAIDPVTKKSTFLSPQFLTTSSRRMQLSLRFSF